MSLWVRALVVCDDVRLELGGTVSLIGVYADRIAVAPGDGERPVSRGGIRSIPGGNAPAARRRPAGHVPAEGSNNHPARRASSVALSP